VKIALKTKFVFLGVKGDELRLSSKYIYFGKRVRNDLSNLALRLLIRLLLGK
jgi:hypothetical protein